ncbi:MAG: KamA family radical SAM protein [Myxococcales bacterium]|nr:MAG: KamA family radical SAM protein [Myxococcales bacterium]
MLLPTYSPSVPSKRDAQDWRWQAQHSLRDLAGLERALKLTDDEREGIEHALTQGFPLAITPYYLSLCDPDNPACPIRLQCIPSAKEKLRSEGDLRDPLGEEAHEVAPRLIQRYPDRVLLFFTDRCGVYCRFCTRSRIVGAGGGAASLKELETAFAYLKSHPDIQEVIVSGGDPLVMSDTKIRALLHELRSIPSIGNIRIASRTPVTLPQRIDKALCETLRSHPFSLADDAF